MTDRSGVPAAASPYHAQKEITFVVPCYNSADYMDHCIDSILRAQGDVEIIIVNDGSRDGTAAKADSWAARFPGIVSVIHQENRGHGGAVMAGLNAATGVYFKVVDSDDWLDPDALNLMLTKLRHFIASGSPVDLVISNYVYENAYAGSQKVIRYSGALPQNRIFTWHEIGFFKWEQNIMMHAATYRTQVLRDSGLELPDHTFYVDNIFVYVPLPHVQTLYYLPVNLYRYFIGREDQSVNEKVMITRLDQQFLVNTMLVDRFEPERIESEALRSYLLHYLSIITSVSLMMAQLAATPEGRELREMLLRRMRDENPPTMKAFRRTPTGFFLLLPGPVGRTICKTGYRVIRRVFAFN